MNLILIISLVVFLPDKTISSNSTSLCPDLKPIENFNFDQVLLLIIIRFTHHMIIILINIK
jgi:hypothetical protein